MIDGAGVVSMMPQFWRPSRTRLPWLIVTPIELLRTSTPFTMRGT